MKRHVGSGLALSLVLLASGASADYVLDAWTVDGGGGRSAGGAYVVTGTIGQADADPLQPSTGGPYAVTGGFWVANDPASSGDHIFRNGFE